MTISVTAEDIAAGEQERCTRCPVALAITRSTGFKTSVSSNHAELKIGIEWKTVDLPPIASRFIRLFDNGKPVRPFSFELEV